MEYKKVPQEIFNKVNDNVQALAKLFPSAVKDGEVDFEALKEELGQFQEVGKEKYELTWAGKQNAKRIVNEDILGKTLNLVPEDSKNANTTENLYIEGDNLEVLKLLRQNYYNSIKMIYIDPPYNTGNDFIYKDNFSTSQTQARIDEGDALENGEKLIINQKGSSRFHSGWLSMIYPRLKIAKELLTNDGIIFISIDDDEVDNLLKVCNEVFGEENFVNLIAIKMSEASGNKMSHANKRFPKIKEYLLVYKKNELNLEPIRLKKEEWDSEYNKFLLNFSEDSRRLIYE